jgi:hypothetical protein
MLVLPFDVKLFVAPNTLTLPADVKNKFADLICKDEPTVNFIPVPTV